METTVTSLLPKVSRILIAAEIVLSSPGSSTSETPLRTSRFVFGSSLLTTVLGSGICLIQTYIFIALSPHLKYMQIGCAGCPLGVLYRYLDPRSLVGYPIVPVRKRQCQRCWLTQSELLKRCFLPALARKRACFVKVWRVLCAWRRTKPSTLSHECAAGVERTITQ